MRVMQLLRINWTSKWKLASCREVHLRCGPQIPCVQELGPLDVQTVFVVRRKYDLVVVQHNWCSQALCRGSKNP